MYQKVLDTKILSANAAEKITRKAAQLFGYEGHILALNPHQVVLRSGQVLVAIIDDEKVAWIGNPDSPMVEEFMRNPMFWGFLPFSWEEIAKSDCSFRKRVPCPEVISEMKNQALPRQTAA